MALPMTAPFAAAMMGAANTILAATTAASIASMMDSAAAGVLNERTSALLDQAKADLMLARKAHDLITAGI